MEYISFFRGINVGGHNKVKMADLRSMLEGCGFANVRTYIQSGNALFETEEAITHADIETAFEREFGFCSHVVLRTAEQLRGIMAAMPFSAAEIERAQAANPNVEHVYIYMANGLISGMENLPPCDGADRLHTAESEIYLLCQDSIRHSKLAANIAKLDTPLTSRNQKTMAKLCAMLAN